MTTVERVAPDPVCAFHPRVLPIERSDLVPNGFTLVVVSIISLLMSVMLPSLTRARRQGEQVHCLANQHQLYLAWTRKPASGSLHKQGRTAWFCDINTGKLFQGSSSKAG